MKYVAVDDVTTIIQRYVGVSTSREWETQVVEPVLPLKEVLQWMDEHINPSKVEYIKVQTCKYKMKRTEDGDYIIHIDWSKRVD